MIRKSVRVGNLILGDGGLPVIIAGPCVIESIEHTCRMVEKIAEKCERYGLGFIFKASFDKANRSSINSYRGPGIHEGLKILEAVREKYSIPVLTDVHESWQIQAVSQVVDMIQIPAFLCRQTDLYIEAGKFDIPINVKKGQFLSPVDMKNILVKAEQSGISGITFTERGSCFGYNRLVVDFTSLPVMRQLGVPVVFDATHSLQLPGGAGEYTDGISEFVPHLCRAAIAVGCEALFLEVHDKPEAALSDKKNVITPDILDEVLRDTVAIHQSLNGVSR